MLLSFTSDPYHRGDTSVTRTTLKILIKRGLAFCTLSKGGTRALRDLDLFRPKRDAFACTLTSLDDRFSKKWERNAALPGDRIKTLRKFHDAGIFTWVSLEPTLDVKSSLALVEATHEFVDLFKVGRTNYLSDDKDHGLARLHAAYARSARPLRGTALHQKGSARVPAGGLPEPASRSAASLARGITAAA